MIPWFQPSGFTVLGLEIRPFDLCVVAGVVAGVWLYDRMLRRGGPIDRQVALRLPEVCLIGGFAGAHLVHVLLYHPELLRTDPWALLKVWGGISSVGGFAFGALAGWIYLKAKRAPLLAYADRALLALSLGWVFGRLGCTLAHDHPGARSDFPLAVRFPGGARHDLGFYEFLLALGLTGWLLLLARRPRRTGSLTAVLLLVYAPARFLLDFLRADDLPFVDARYLGLTPAQYGMGLLAAAGIAAWRRSRSEPIDIPLVGRR